MDMQRMAYYTNDNYSRYPKGKNKEPTQTQEIIISED